MANQAAIFSLLLDDVRSIRSSDNANASEFFKAKESLAWTRGVSTVG